MARWKRGEAEVEALIASGDLQKLTGEAANGGRLLEKAAVTLETARLATERDPDSAFVLAYDAARQAVTALLAHQGLRPTTKGGHYAVEQAVRAQFGPGFRQRTRSSARPRASSANSVCSQSRCHRDGGNGTKVPQQSRHGSPCLMAVLQIRIADV